MTTATRPAFSSGTLARKPATSAVARQGRPGTPRFAPSRIAALLILIVLAAAWLLPFLWAVATAFKTETDAASGDPSWIGASGPTIEAFTAILSQGNVYTWAFNSLWTSIAVTLITLTISALAAAGGAWGVRVHDVTASRDAVAVAAAWTAGGRRGLVDDLTQPGLAEPPAGGQENAAT